MSKVTTIQLTSKKLKGQLIISYIFIIVGILLIITNAGANHDSSSIGWGAFSTLIGFGWLAVTRIRIWWNHK